MVDTLKTFPPAGVDEDALEALNRDGSALFRRLVATLGVPRSLTLSAWDVERTREWALDARPAVHPSSGLVDRYEVVSRETANEFRGDQAVDAALVALVGGFDLGADLAHLRFEGEDDEWRLDLGHFRVAGVPVCFAVVALW